MSQLGKRLLVQSIASVVLATASYQTMAAQQLEEIVVTARKVEESLQDVPVTVTAIGAKTMEQYGVDDTSQLMKLVPNLTLQKGGSGAGGSIRLRGVGNSTISGAFDTAVSFNIDGLQVNNARFLFQGMFDMEQIEVLKGPQSLYFGKSASAGVLTMRSKNPGDEFEAGIKVSREFEYDGTTYEGFVSGPVTDTFGARLAVRRNTVDELTKNTSGPSNIGGIPTGVTPTFGQSFLGPDTSTPRHEWRGEESTDARLTLTWDPTESLSANMKGFVSKYNNDGEIYMTDIDCAGASTPPPDVNVLGMLMPVGGDCDPFDGEMQINDNGGILGYGSPSGSVPYYKADIQSVGLTVDYDLTENLMLTSVTGYFHLKSEASDNFNFTNNYGPSSHRAIYDNENWSQEFRIASSYGGTFDFAAGAYYQTRDKYFSTHQQVGLAASFLAGPDPVTGYTTDWRKDHDTTADAWSYYLNLIFRPIETVEVSIGARQNHEKHKNKVFIPYVHTAYQGIGLVLDPGTKIDGIEFKDDDLTPEASVNWRVRDNISLYAAYKTGFKSGGIDNSLLAFAPVPGAPSYQDQLVFKSETVSGYEVGMKSDLLDNSLRLNVSAYRYIYKDLQLQEFDTQVFNYSTLNAGEITTEGVELEALWATPVDGLTLGGALTYSDASYTDDFYVLAFTQRENQKGKQIQQNSRWAGNLSIDYERPISDTLVMNLGIFSSYRSKYQTGIFHGSYEQDGVVKTDASISVGDADEKWKVALIGSNLEDEVTAISMLSFRTTAVPNAQGVLPQILNISHGRQVKLQLEYNF